VCLVDSDAQTGQTIPHDLLATRLRGVGEVGIIVVQIDGSRDLQAVPHESQLQLEVLFVYDGVVGAVDFQTHVRSGVHLLKNITKTIVSRSSDVPKLRRLPREATKVTVPARMFVAQLSVLYCPSQMKSCYKLSFFRRTIF